VIFSHVLHSSVCFPVFPLITDHRVNTGFLGSDVFRLLPAGSARILSQCLPTAYLGMRQKLTPTVVFNARAEPGAERTIYWDEALPGFGLMATAKGHKSFVFQYRAGRTSRRMTLDGKFLRLENEREKAGGSRVERHARRVRTPFEAARAEAAAVHAAVKTGRDPLKELRDKAAAGANTFKSIAEEYLRREGGMKRDANGRASFSGDRLRSANQRLAVFERLVYPKLGSLPIDEIKRSDLGSVDIHRNWDSRRGKKLIQG
jgi:hypothetical protein